MTISYAKRNPLATLTVPDELSTKLEAVLNLPFPKMAANGSTNNDSADTKGLEGPTKPMAWRGTIDLGHIDNNEMRTEILTMLTKQEHKRTTGKLREKTATEHKITL